MDKLGGDSRDSRTNYINRSGNRYAAAGKYEVHLRNTYNKITRNTFIDELQLAYKSISS